MDGYPENWTVSTGSFTEESLELQGNRDLKYYRNSLVTRQVLNHFYSV